MDIYILREGQQTGPFSEENVQTQLRGGDVTLDDFAWREGLPTWQPLSAVLYPKSATQKILPPPPANAPTPTPEPFLSPVARPEPATAKQKAFLNFLGIPFAGDLTKERAAVLLHDAADDPKLTGRIKRWEQDKLRLHPELFADEIQARRENRSAHFLEICQTEGAEFFHDVTKAHAQVLVGYLDVQHPNWDEHADASRYFFAAIAEKFPQLVKGSARGQLKYPDGPKAASEMERSGLTTRPRRKRSPLVAALRGIAIGLVLLAALYGASVFYERHLAAWLGTEESAPPLADVPLPTPPVETPKPAEETVDHVPKKARKAARNTAARAATPAVEVAAIPTASEPPTAAAMIATPAPATPTPATIPEAPPAVAMTATTTPAPAPPTAPLLTLAPDLAATPSPTPAPRTSVKITKPTTVSLRFGSSTLSAGTMVPFVSSDGVNAMVRFGPDVIAVPVANTDLTPAPQP